MLTYLIPALVGVIAGAVAGGLVAWWLVRRQPRNPVPVVPADPWLNAEIDRAAVAWATDSGHPEAAGLMADKLHLLHHLGTQRRRP